MSSFEVMHTDPVILFSHIPMYRHDGKGCGPLREKGTLRPGVGLGYQNTLEKHASKRLLEALKPIAVFWIPEFNLLFDSGDDHDYCKYTPYSDPLGGLPRLAIPEVTVPVGWSLY
jgi:ethanolamine phosphate phosphodiesterase